MHGVGNLKRLPCSGHFDLENKLILCDVLSLNCSISNVVLLDECFI